jgi:carbonic anhydrase
MKLFEAIIEANRRRVAGEVGASVPLVEQGAALPIAALTCIDARLNHLLPEMLGIPEEKFIWLRNSGNIITGPVSSTMRSLAMACAIKGAKEIVIIGHSDCLVCKTTAMNLLDRFAALGVERHRLPENLVEYFGLFASERQNVMRGADIIRGSPLIGAKVPVHGLLIDIKTGQLEWVVNGYDASRTIAGRHGEVFQKADDAFETLGKIGSLTMGEMKFPETKIGELVKTAQDWVHKAEQVADVIEDKIGHNSAAAGTPVQPPVVPPPRRIPGFLSQRPKK